MKSAREITARNTPESIRKALEDARGDDTWLDLLIEGARARGVDINYRSPGVGRPSKAFDAEAYAEAKRQEYLAKVAEDNALNVDKVAAIKKELGIDTEKGSTSGFFMKDQLKRRNEG